MTIKTIITCDKCGKDMGAEHIRLVTNIKFINTVRMDFCGYDCMKYYLLKKFKEYEQNDAEIEALEREL